MKGDIDCQAINEKAVEFVRTWRTTDNALEALATRHNYTLLIVDEMSQVPPNKVGAVAYLLGNGQGKGRGRREGPGTGGSIDG